MTARTMDSGVGGDVTLFHTSQLDKLINMARESSLWYLLFGLACCGIELIQTGGPRADLMRFGAIPRASPLTTTTPARARPSATRRALSRPSREAARDPTTALDRVDHSGRRSG